ncbi:uncharacterized protein [Ptychodera flava]|uniref:uncharacterized protein n=1 Tax=Ptychodera flava TaxID=63121 RepID=UPI00396A17CC
MEGVFPRYRFFSTDYTLITIHSYKPDSTTKPALTSLKDDNSIVIGRADKGGATVVWNAKDYEAECLRQLSDKQIYEEVSSDHSTQVHNKLTDLVASFNLPQKEKETILQWSNRKGAYFYILGKIHKIKTLGDLPPGRPICSQIGAPTRAASLWLDWKLSTVCNKYCTELVKDTTQFLQHVNQLNANAPLPYTHILALDVIALYPNIDIDEGICALKEALYTSSDENSSNIDNILKLAMFVLQNNYFEFNNQYYRQISGTAMGTPFAVSYANIYMSWWMRKYYFTTPNCPEVTDRFIDDLAALSTSSEKELHCFVNQLNMRHDKIKFTAEISKTSIPFLDVRLYLMDNRLETDLYSKPTSSHRYLPPNSCHPPHIFRSIVYSGSLRIRRICSKPEWCDERLTEFARYLKLCGYRTKTIKQQIAKASIL